MSGSVGGAPREVARAAQKPVLRAGGAPQEQGALDGLSRPVQTDRDVIHGHPEGCGHLLAGFAEQIHAPQDVSILGFERRQQCVETGAYSALQIGLLPTQGLVLGIGGFLPSACRFTTGIVRQHSTEQPIEPREDTFTLAEFERPADHTEVELLQDLFCSLRVPQTLGQHAEEIPVMLDQCCLDGGL
jgi:hypothetical protein